MKLHRRKMIAPIVVTILTVLYFAVYFGFLITLVNGVWRVLLGVLPFVFSTVMIMVCIERIKEIRKGEEDDIGKY